MPIEGGHSCALKKRGSCPNCERTELCSWESTREDRGTLYHLTWVQYDSNQITLPIRMRHLLTSLRHRNVPFSTRHLSYTMSDKAATPTACRMRTARMCKCESFAEGAITPHRGLSTCISKPSPGILRAVSRHAYLRRSGTRAQRHSSDAPVLGGLKILKYCIIVFKIHTFEIT